LKCLKCTGDASMSRRMNRGSAENDRLATEFIHAHCHCQRIAPCPRLTFEHARPKIPENPPQSPHTLDPPHCLQPSAILPSTRSGRFPRNSFRKCGRLLSRTPRHFTSLLAWSDLPLVPICQSPSIRFAFPLPSSSPLQAGLAASFWVHFRRFPQQIDIPSSRGAARRIFHFDGIRPRLLPVHPLFGSRDFPSQSPGPAVRRDRARVTTADRAPAAPR
jgi:hypothetical protein